MKKVALAGALAAALLAAANASAADPVVNLKLSHWVPPSHPLQPALEAWAADLEKESGGTLKSTIFPAQQLGKAVDHYDMAKDGIADFAYVNPGYQPGRFPIFAAADLPFLMSNAKGGSKALDMWYRQYAAKEMSDVHYCLAFVHDPGVFNSRDKKIMVPADIKGLKVRPADDTIGELVRRLGGTNVQASAPEARDVIARGVADAITFPWHSLILFGIDKATKYHMDVPLYVTGFVWVMNKGKYESLTPMQKKAVDDHCTADWAEKIAAPWADWEAAGREIIKKEPGHDVYSISPAQLAEWRKAAAPLSKEWEDGARKAGIADPEKALAALKADLKKEHAAY